MQADCNALVQYESTRADGTKPRGAATGTLIHPKIGEDPRDRWPTLSKKMNIETIALRRAWYVPRLASRDWPNVSSLRPRNWTEMICQACLLKSPWSSGG